MKKIFLFVLFILSTQSLIAQYSKKVDRRIQHIENGLRGKVQTKDMKGWSLEERMAYYNVKGISIAVVNDYKIEWAQGYGWADTLEQRPVTTETIFQAASISKSLNGVGVLKLVQEKKLDLYTDINTYLKSWQFPYNPNFKKITTAHLLSHTAGLGSHFFPGYTKEDSLPSITDILDGKGRSNTPDVRSLFEPGVNYQYSGGGILISQLMVTDITHQPYDEYMIQNVLRPMGMNNSFYTLAPTKEKEQLMATAYHADGEKINGKYHIYPEQAPAGLWTTPTDLCKYIIETQLSYQNKSSKVLTSEMTKLRLTPYVDTLSALGVFIDKRGTKKYFQHTGDNEGFSSMYYGSLDGKGIAIMANSDDYRIFEEIVNRVAYEYQWKDFYHPIIELGIKDIRKKKVINIDNFDKSGFVALTKGKWQSYDDHHSGGKSKDTLEYVRDSTTKNQALRLTYTLDKGTFKWSPYVYMKVEFAPEQIPKEEIAGIAYDFKGDSHLFKYSTSSIKDYCYYERNIVASQDWTTIMIPLEALVQPGWGKKAPFNAKDLNALLWINLGKTGDTGNITIDNVRFYKK